GEHPSQPRLSRLPARHGPDDVVHGQGHAQIERAGPAPAPRQRRAASRGAPSPRRGARAPRRPARLPGSGRGRV
ncbi:MAG: hypothetical protein AVDCRST_MAG53-1300, partial [uncultured Solirubrobacteraceae bacterium]